MLHAKGRVRVFPTFPDGTRGPALIDVHNLVVNAGLDTIARLIGGCQSALGLPVPPGPPHGGGFYAIPGANADERMTSLAVDAMWLGKTVSPAAAAPGDFNGIGANAILQPSDLAAELTVSGGGVTVSYPSTGVVTFEGSIPPGAWDAPNPPITSETLMTAMGTLFARVVFPVGVNTLPGSGLTFRHDITFVANDAA